MDAALLPVHRVVKHTCCKFSCGQKANVFQLNFELAFIFLESKFRSSHTFVLSRKYCIQLFYECVFNHFWFMQHVYMHAAICTPNSLKVIQNLCTCLSVHINSSCCENYKEYMFYVYRCIHYKFAEILCPVRSE